MSTAGSSTQRPSGLRRLVPLLRPRIPKLTAAVGDRLHVVDSAMTRGNADSPPTVLLDCVERHLSRLLDGLESEAGRESGSGTETERIGQLPADAVAQTLPAESLVRAYRISTHVLWDALRESAQRDASVDPSELVHLATILWAFHDAACAAVERAQRDADRWGGRLPEEHRDVLVADLLEGRAWRPADARDAAAYLKLRPVGRYVVVAVERADGQPPGDLERQIAGAGFVSAWQHLPGQCLGIVELGTAELATLVLAVGAAGEVGTRVGISPVVQALADLPAARRHADTALLTLARGRGGVAVLEGDLPGALLASSPDLAALLLHRFLGPVLELEEGDRDALLATVQTYAATGASATDAARALSCHRNTVLNRIRRFEQLSGRPLDSPAALLTTWLATRAHELDVDAG